MKIDLTKVIKYLVYSNLQMINNLKVLGRPLKTGIVCLYSTKGCFIVGKYGTFFFPDNLNIEKL